MWSASAGLCFAALLLLASGAVSSLPNVSRFWSFNVYRGTGFSLATPLIYGMAVPHVWVVGPWSTFLLIAASATLVGLNLRAALARAEATARCAPRRGTVAALTPSLLVVSSCCGTPLALLAGTSAVVFLYRATPWLLLATTAMLAFGLALQRRDPSSTRTTGRSRRAGAEDERRVTAKA